MMCEHEFVEIQIKWFKETKSAYSGWDAGGDEISIYGKRGIYLCKHCGTLEFEQQLAAANAWAAELEKERDMFLEKWQQTEFDLFTLSDVKQRAEQAEKNFEDAKDKIAMMGAEIVRLSEGKEQVEARIIGLEKELSDCKNMEDVAYRLRESLREEISSANARIKHLEDMVESITIKSKCADCDVEAQNTRMRELLVEIQSYAETYVDLNPRMKHIIGCAKVALGGGEIAWLNQHNKRLHRNKKRV